MQLEIVQSGLIVAAQALHHGNADFDVDVARVLEYGVGDRLNVQLECISEIIAMLQPDSNEVAAI